MLQDIRQCKRIINAVKSGVVPDAELRSICVGRDKEIKEFERCIELTKEGHSVVKFITGTYGTGKSFLLKVIKQIALKENVVVASVKIEKNFKFNKGEEIYYQIMHNLSIRNSETNGTSFEEIFNIWITQLQNDKTNAVQNINKVIGAINDYNSSFAVAFTNYIKAKIGKDTELSNSISAWIKGEKNIPASIKSKFGIKSDVDKSSYMSFLKAFIKLLTLLGYGGLVILVDEMELIVSERSNIREVSYENLRNIIDISADGEIDNCMFIFAGTNELFENEEKGLKTYAALHKRITSSYDIDNDGLLRDLRQTVIKIKGLVPNDLCLLTGNMIEIHKRVFNWNPLISEETIKQYAEIACAKFGNTITEANTREFLKKVVDALDIMEQNPGINLFEKEIAISGRIVTRLEKKIEVEDSIINEIMNDPLFDEDSIVNFN
jgi:hypothetical protein